MAHPNKFSTMFGFNLKEIQFFSSRLNQQNLCSILLTMGYSLTVYNYLILFFHHSQSYIVDIYSELPLSFFISLIFCYAIGSGVILLSQGSNRKLGIVLLIFTYFTILVIPYMLGYYSMGRWDDMSYIGEYLQISKSGYIAQWDIYPASHIIGAIISIETGLEPHFVSFVIPIVFSFILVVGLFLLCRPFLKDQMLINIAIPSLFILYLGPYNFLNVPHALFFATMPLFISILFRFIEIQNFSNIILIFPFTFIIPYTHPFIVFFVISTLFFLIAFSNILKKFGNKNFLRTTIPLIIIIVGFFSWFIYFPRFLSKLKQIFVTYSQKTMAIEPVFFETTDKIFRIDIDPYKIIKLLTLYYGRYVIPMCIISIALIIIFLKRDRISQILKNNFIFWIIFYLFFLIMELILFFNPIVSHQPDRMTNLNFMVYAQVPLFVLSLYVIFLQPKSSNLKIMLILLILSSTWSLSLFGAFNAPNVFKSNDAVSYNEVQGMKWFSETRIPENVFTTVTTQIWRFDDLFANPRVYNDYLIPYHFGYVNDNRSFSEITSGYTQQNYIILFTIDELLYQDVPGYKEVGRYNAEDFHRFKNDNSVNKIFDDTNIEIFQEI
jgi:hypothetical protein